MIHRRFYKTLAVILALSFGGVATAHGFADCDSPCCGQRQCQRAYERAVPERCHQAGAFVEEIKSASCKMIKGRILETAQAARLTAPQTARPAGKMSADLFFDGRVLSNSLEARVRRTPSTVIRAAPDPLYLQNLTLLI
jgi:hypothetical protein